MKLVKVYDNGVTGWVIGPNHLSEDEIRILHWMRFDSLPEGAIYGA